MGNFADRRSRAWVLSSRVARGNGANHHADGQRKREKAACPVAVCTLVGSPGGRRRNLPSGDAFEPTQPLVDYRCPLARRDELAASSTVTTGLKELLRYDERGPGALGTGPRDLWATSSRLSKLRWHAAFRRGVGMSNLRSA